MRRTSTDQNLNLISTRNRGHRASLFTDDDYKNSSSDEEITSLKKTKEKKLERKLSQLTHEEVKSKIAFINDRHQHTRKRKPKKSHHSTTISETNHDYRSHFGDIEFLEASTSILDDPDLQKSLFFGIYVLFWLATAFLMLNNLVHAYMEDDTPFYNTPIVKILRKDLFKVAMTDLSMYLSTYFAFWVQYLCKKGTITWQKTGWVLQIVYDYIFLHFWLIFSSPHWANYPWIARVFLLLHSLVLVMKMHSYAFYNGYLWTIKEELEFSEEYLARCDDLPDDPEKIDPKNKEILEQSIKFCKFELEYQESKKYSSNNPNVQESYNPISFPENITARDFFLFTMFPTLVYTINFPRTKRIRWKYVGVKILAIFGIFFLMILIAQNMYPLVIEAQSAQSLPLGLKIKKYLLVLLDIIPYFLLQYIFTFFIIWEFILNAIAELSMFADRDFYGPWWSCTDFGEFARIWNRPVHKFLLRHVYHSSISAFKLNKQQASLFTFILSSLVHELVMFSIFRVFRGYLLLFQMSQLPLIMLSNTKFMKEKKILGNCICWIGFISGPSIICTLYLFF